MAKRKKRRTKRSGLNGFTRSSSRSSGNIKDTLKEGLVLGGSALMGGVLGAAVGRPSLILGIPVALYGIHKKKKIMTAVGAGLVLSSGFKTGTAVNGVEGFSMKSMAEGAKDRVKAYFSNVSDKLYLPQSNALRGLDGNDEVSYFMNPYNNEPMASTPELDTSAMDQVQIQIAEMAGADGSVGNLEYQDQEPPYQMMGEIDPSELNF